METNNKAYKIGIALSGGGAKGLAHLGALQAINEVGIYPEVISGTSSGAFAGVFYADGHSPKDILSYFQNKAFREFAEFTLPKSGIFKNSRFNNFLSDHLTARTFEELKIPLHIVATDIEFGESHIFSSGELIQAIIASCTVPIVFTPVKIGEHHYVDGGLLKNFPVSIIRKKCDKVIGINVSPLTRSAYKESLKYVAERSFHYMSASNTLLDRNLCDYLIESPNLSKYSMFDLDHTQEIYELGYHMTKNYLVRNQKQMEQDLGITFK